MEILTYGNDLLKQKSDDVTVFDDKLKETVDLLFRMMDEHDGVGLAAPQVGVLRKIIVIDPREEGIELHRMELINPEIIEFSNDRIKLQEGCLSVPDIYADVVRPVGCIVRAQNLKGKEIVLNADGVLSRILQHEIDHLHGVLFVDRLEELEKKQIYSELKKLRKKTKSNLKNQKPKIAS